MQLRPLGAVLAATAIYGIAGSTPAALAGLPDGASAESMKTLPNTWFVQLKGAPTADGSALSNVRAEKAAFRSAATRAGVTFSERYSYDVLFNGVSVVASRSDVQKIKSLPNVAAVWPVAVVDAPVKASAPSPDLLTAIRMTGADIAQSELGFTGAGVKVAVMDTGIDIEHPAFGGNGSPITGTGTFPTARVTHGWDFVGDTFNADPGAAGYNPDPAPDANPDDCNGHGSHVAGIVGANEGTDGLKGVAPEVTFGAYRVFGCAGSTTAEIMIAAMERALADGMDVLNMSIGSAFQWPQYPTALAADRLVNQGMVVVASIGNSGTNGLYAAGAPGLGSKVIGTASFDNSHVMLPYFTSNGRDIGYQTMTFSPDPPTSGTEEIVWLGRGCVDSDPATGGNQTDPYLGDPNGKVALVQRGSCSFAEKATRAISAGATAVVVQNNVAGVVSGTLGAALPDPRPVVGISLADGEFLRAQSTPVMMTWTDQQASFPSPTGGLISSFSSYGLSPDLALKPDIGAPGGNIYSAYPLESGGYANISGTSMASPHVAGAAALLLQAKPNTSPQMARNILQNSADPKNWWGNPGLGFLDQVHRQGAGMVDIDDAILAPTRIDPAKLALGESEAGPATRTLTIRNASAIAITYDLSHAPALSTNANTFTPGATTGFASVVFSAPSVTVPAKGTATVDVTITASTALASLSQYGGYLVFTPQGGGETYRIPYAGLKGDYQSKPVLTGGFPLVGVAVPASCIRVLGFDCIGGRFAVPGSNVFTMADAYSVPQLLVHFDHQARLFRVEIYDTSGTSWYREYNEDYMPRNNTATAYFAFPLDGVTFSGGKTYTLPDGSYYAKVSVLKALGDAANPAHWETWTSPTFVIARP
ncbi:MAG TPA: S8 family serine peptidase [Steroidobacteraceae bacterium]|nr:S8 family serine peptidase [Steroidobacteraceae bacterium]